MLYMIDEYVKEYPNRCIQALSWFKDYSKNLHELSLEDINNITGKLKPLTDKTMSIRKREVINYLKWLQSQGVKTNLDLFKGVSFPVVEKRFLIYSTADIAYYYNILFDILEKQAVKNGTTFNKLAYYISYASGILSFYGLTVEQIFDLDLSDVQKDGISKYDLPLTPQDIEVLLAYKNLHTVSRNVALSGTKYIRFTARTKHEVNFEYLFRPVWRLDLPEEAKYLKGLLNISNLYLLGIYNKVYQYEKANKDYLKSSAITQQWFIDYISGGEEVSPSTVMNRKNDYLKYRVERDGTQTMKTTTTSTLLEITPDTEPIVENKNDMIYLEKLTEKFNMAVEQMNQLGKQMNQLSMTILEIKKQIELIKK